MKYKISICHPDKKKIEILPNELDRKKALAFFNEYPWMEQLAFLDSMKQEEVQYSPSIRFTNTSNNISLEMTADSKDGKLFFSLWFERPVRTKILFGLLGKKDKMKLTDKWGFDHASSKQHLAAFLDENYNEVERIMKK